MSGIDRVLVGQVWRHVGYEGLPATNLRVRIEGMDLDGEGAVRGFYVTYPADPAHRRVRYWGSGLGRAYVLESGPPVEPSS